jgi:hypothetical protein
VNNYASTMVIDDGYSVYDRLVEEVQVGIYGVEWNSYRYKRHSAKMVEIGKKK